MTRFSQITPDTTLQAKLASAYTAPDDLDVYVGLLSEKLMTGKMVGRDDIYYLERSI